MITTTKIKQSFFSRLVRPITTAEMDIKNTTLSKVNSLAYLAYKNKKQKELITNDAECPTIFFGDEWAL